MAHRRSGRIVLMALVVLGVAYVMKGRRAQPPPSPVPVASTPLRFVEVAAQAGIDHVHAKPVLDAKVSNIMPWLSSVGAAAAAADFDRDGWIDLFVSSSAKGTPNRLYRNLGGGRFQDVGEAAGVAAWNDAHGVVTDCAWGDVDNDGWPDLYLVRWGRDVLLRNRGDGTFENVTAERFRQRDGSPGTDWVNGNAVLFFDFDRDGRLDIYVGNYFDDVDLWHLTSTRIMHDDFEKSRNGGRNFLYHQLPDGTFREVAGSLGLDDPGWTLAVGSADLDNDGWPDLYCANDFGPDQLFVNRGDGSFENISQQAIGVDTKKGMNVDFGDFDNDGWLDVYVANITTSEYLKEGNMLWRNNGLGTGGHVTFVDVAWETGTHDGGWGWGAKFFDGDHDGDLDLFAVNGFISAGPRDYWYDLASWTVQSKDPADAANWPPIEDRSFSGHEPARFWRNDGGGLFVECASAIGLATRRDGRGVVVFDYDNDGDMDLYVANQGQPPELFRNEQVGGHWLQVRLETDPRLAVNRDAIGTRVSIVTEAGLQVRERDGGNGFCGQSDPRLHFGLGHAQRVDLIEVRWPDGGLQYFEKVAANQVLVLRQDADQYAERPALVVPPPRPEAGDARAPLAAAPIDLQAVDAELAALEAALVPLPQRFGPASAYRARCVATGQHDRAIAFFEARVAAAIDPQAPEHWRARLELACALVDKIPSCGGIAAIVSKGTLARKSLDQLDRVLELQPHLWVAYYCRGMNHLHWPRALRHTDDAVRDFERCLELQATLPRLAPHHVRPHIGLGDAQAKGGDYAVARAGWRRGLEQFPTNEDLRQRLAIASDSELLRFIEVQRSLEQPIDTSLSFADSSPVDSSP